MSHNFKQEFCEVLQITSAVFVTLSSEIRSSIFGFEWCLSISLNFVFTLSHDVCFKTHISKQRQAEHFCQLPALN